MSRRDQLVKVQKQLDVLTRLVDDLVRAEDREADARDAWQDKLRRNRAARDAW